MARARSLGVAQTAIARPKRSAVPARRNVAASKSVKLNKVIRDSFTMPVADHQLIGSLKRRCIGLGIAMKKSELLRAGLAALEGMSDERLAEVVSAVEAVKTGRPPGKKKHKKQKKKKKKRKTNRAKDKR